MSLADAIPGDALCDPWERPPYTGIGAIASAPIDRLMERIRVTDDGCWLWVGTVNGAGYAQIKYAATRRREVAHRLAYRAFIGPIPEGLSLDHLCQVRACVNPWHLEPVSMRENILRGNGLPARNARRTRCINGHPFTEENTYLVPGGLGRGCKECRRMASRKHELTRAKRPRRRVA